MQNVPTLNIPDTQKEFSVAPEGTHLARIISVVDMGTMEYDGQYGPRKQHKIRVAFELPNETYDYEVEGKTIKKHFVVSRKYTLSKSPKSHLFPVLNNLLGYKEGEVNIFSLLALPCMISIAHWKGDNGKTSASVGTVTKVLKGMEIPAQINDSVWFSWDAYDKDTFDSLPKFVKEDLMKSDEFKTRFPSEVDISAPNQDDTDVGF